LLQRQRPRRRHDRRRRLPLRPPHPDAQRLGMDVELAGDLRDAVGLAAGEPDRLAPKVLRVRRASSFLAHGAPPASNLLRGAGGVHQTGGGPPRRRSQSLPRGARATRGGTFYPYLVAGPATRGVASRSLARPRPLGRTKGKSSSLVAASSWLRAPAARKLPRHSYL